MLDGMGWDEMGCCVCALLLLLLLCVLLSPSKREVSFYQTQTRFMQSINATRRRDDVYYGTR